MMDFNEIIVSWVRKFNPTENQKRLSEERLTICTNCVYYQEILKKKVWTAICNKCNCPIPAKIFTPKTESCPIGKWVEIDKKYGIYIEDKTKKTIL